MAKKTGITPEVKKGVTVTEIGEKLSENGITVTNKDVIVKALNQLSGKMTVNVISADEEISGIEAVLGSKLSKEQISGIKNRHKDALDVPDNYRKAIRFSRTCVEHTTKLIATL